MILSNALSETSAPGKSSPGCTARDVGAFCAGAAPEANRHDISAVASSPIVLIVFSRGSVSRGVGRRASAFLGARPWPACGAALARRYSTTTVAAFALAVLAHRFGVRLGHRLLLGLGRRGRGVERHHVAEHRVEAEPGQALGEMRRQFCFDIDLAAFGVVDRDAPRMEVHLAADSA